MGQDFNDDNEKLDFIQVNFGMVLDLGRINAKPNMKWNIIYPYEGSKSLRTYTVLMSHFLHVGPMFDLIGQTMMEFPQTFLILRSLQHEGKQPASYQKRGPKNGMTNIFFQSEMLLRSTFRLITYKIYDFTPEQFE